MADQNTMRIFHNISMLVQSQEQRIGLLLNTISTLTEGIEFNSQALLNLEQRIRTLEGAYVHESDDEPSGVGVISESEPVDKELLP